MKLTSLRIRDVRGVRELELRPEGDNLLVYGPNGSGKSGVVDALDFLLTGRIGRLTGPGTAGITLQRHGPNLMGDEKDASVSGTFFALRLGGRPFTLTRRMSRASELESEGISENDLSEVLSVAERGHYLLSRRELLNYITAEAGTRGERVQALLGLEAVETTRKLLVKTRNALKTSLAAAEAAVQNSQSAVAATLGLASYDGEAILAQINQCRVRLGGQPLQIATSASVRSTVSAPAGRMPDAVVSLQYVERLCEPLRCVLKDDAQSEISRDDDALRRRLRELRLDTGLQRQLRSLSLVKEGLELIDESGSCPLCDHAWPLGYLREHLEEKLNAATAAQEAWDALHADRDRLRGRLSGLGPALDLLLATARKAPIDDAMLVPLLTWRARLKQLEDALDDPISSYPQHVPWCASVTQSLAPADVASALDGLCRELQRTCPPVSETQDAWDVLVKIEANLKALEAAHDEASAIRAPFQRAQDLHDTYLRQRESVLEALYRKVSRRFEYLYRKLHQDDETAFEAIISQEKTGVKLDVSFHGRGLYPPHAVHSEGHQDSMGLCLYLALNEQLSAGILELVCLDDVVMSVDEGHRKRLCDLLVDEFREVQFVITTHDRLWASQLRKARVVKKANAVEFYGWSLEAGPQVRGADMWDLIRTRLDEDDVPQAAAALRRGLEDTCSHICDSLGASVRYSADGRFEFGDFVRAAMSRYSELLKAGKRSAQERGDRAALETLQERDSQKSRVFARLQAEQWAINPNVHYNNWAQFSKEDFAPVVDAFHDFELLFTCPKCNGILQTIDSEGEPLAVACRCRYINWYLSG